MVICSMLFDAAWQRFFRVNCIGPGLGLFRRGTPLQVLRRQSTTLSPPRGKSCRVRARMGSSWSGPRPQDQCVPDTK